MGLGQFVREYRTVRRAEGWGSQDAAYYRALPYRDLSGRYPGIWRIRARSYVVFINEILRPLERKKTPLRILDLGAGNGWLAYRLARRGHEVIAIDVLEDRLDGLGAIRQYAGGTRVLPLQAEFDHLPIAPESADIAIFDAAFHYSTNYATTLRESLRVLQPRGTLVILDSPMYSDPTSGMRMVQEREARFSATYGFASNALGHEHFLTPERLDQLSAQLSLSWRTYQPRLDVRTAVERKFNGLRAGREPARFPVIVGHRA